MCRGRERLTYFQTSNPPLFSKEIILICWSTISYAFSQCYMHSSTFESALSLDVWIVQSQKYLCKLGFTDNSNQTRYYIKLYITISFLYKIKSNLGDLILGAEVRLCSKSPFLKLLLHPFVGEMWIIIRNPQSLLFKKYYTAHLEEQKRWVIQWVLFDSEALLSSHRIPRTMKEKNSCSTFPHISVKPKYVFQMNFLCTVCSSLHLEHATWNKQHHRFKTTVVESKCFLFNGV